MAISSGAEEVSQSTVDVYVTAQGTDQKLAKTAELNLPQPSQKPDAVFVDSSKTYQTIVDVGGALTDASAETFYKLPRTALHEFVLLHWPFLKIRPARSPASGQFVGHRHVAYDGVFE